MERRTISSGAALAESWSLLIASPLKALVAIVVLSALGVLADSLPESSGLGLNLPIALASLFFQYQISQDRLARLGLIAGEGPRSGVAALFGLGILTNLGILFGLVLLILPGIFLAVRWALSVPILIAENSRVIEAMQRSWDETKGNFWPIFITLLVVYSPIVLLFVGAFVAGFMDAEESVVLSVVLNIVLNVVVVAGWHAAIALYAQTGRGRGGMADIFA